jgi:hypothetical protein
MVIVEVLCFLWKLECCCTPDDCFCHRGTLVSRLLFVRSVAIVLRGVWWVPMRFQRVDVVGFPVCWYLLVYLSHRILNVLDGALAASVIIDKLVFLYEERGRGLGHVHFLVQVLNLHHIAPHGTVDEGPMGGEVPVRGELASYRWKFLDKGSCIVGNRYQSVVPEFGTDSFEHIVEIEWVQVCLSILYRKGVLVVPYNHLDEFDDRLACLGGELDVVCVKLIF